MATIMTLDAPRYAPAEMIKNAYNKLSLPFLSDKAGPENLDRMKHINISFERIEPVKPIRRPTAPKPAPADTPSSPLTSMTPLEEMSRDLDLYTEPNELEGLFLGWNHLFGFGYCWATYRLFKCKGVDPSLSLKPQTPEQIAEDAKFMQLLPDMLSNLQKYRGEIYHNRPGACHPASEAYWIDIQIDKIIESIKTEQKRATCSGWTQRQEISRLLGRILVFLYKLRITDAKTEAEAKKIALKWGWQKMVRLVLDDDGSFGMGFRTVEKGRTPNGSSTSYIVQGWAFHESEKDREVSRWEIWHRAQYEETLNRRWKAVQPSSSGRCLVEGKRGVVRIRNDTKLWL